MKPLEYAGSLVARVDLFRLAEGSRVITLRVEVHEACTGCGKPTSYGFDIPTDMTSDHDEVLDALTAANDKIYGNCNCYHTTDGEPTADTEVN